jgi:hypothetical protein
MTRWRLPQSSVRRLFGSGGLCLVAGRDRLDEDFGQQRTALGRGMGTMRRDALGARRRKLPELGHGLSAGRPAPAVASAAIDPRSLDTECRRTIEPNWAPFAQCVGSSLPRSNLPSGEETVG